MTINGAFSLPSGWAYATIGELIPADGVFIDGDWVESKDQDPRGSVRLVQLADIGDGVFIDKSNRHLTKKKAYELACTFLERGDVLVARMPEPLGRACIFPLGGDERYVTVVDVCVIRLSGSSVDPKYLMHLLNSPAIRAAIADFQSGSTRKRISRGNLAKIHLPIAPLEEQLRIIAKIEELFSELEKGLEVLNTVREHLRVYRQSVLKYAFAGKLTEACRKAAGRQETSGFKLLEEVNSANSHCYAEKMRQWQSAVQEWKKAGRIGKCPQRPEKPADRMPVSATDVANLPDIPESWMYVRLATLAEISSGMSVSKNRILEDPEEVPYLRVANVQRGRLDLAHIARMKIEKCQLPQLRLKKWDVLFNEGGDRDKLGRGWIWEDQITPCITQNHVFRASPYIATEEHAKFLSYWGNTFGQDYFIAEGKQTTNLASISKTTLSSFPIPLPSLLEQTAIVREIEERLSLADALLADTEAALERHAVLRQAILRNAFSGRLVAQNAKDEPAEALLERIRAEQEGTTTKKARATKNGRREAA